MQIFLLVVVFGLFNGIVLLPVLLSLIGPKPYHTAGEDGTERRPKIYHPRKSTKDEQQELTIKFVPPKLVVQNSQGQEVAIELLDKAVDTKDSM
jgi:hypothetical protein